MGTKNKKYIINNDPNENQIKIKLNKRVNWAKRKKVLDQDNSQTIPDASDNTSSIVTEKNPIQIEYEEKVLEI